MPLNEAFIFDTSYHTTALHSQCVTSVFAICDYSWRHMISQGEKQGS